MSTIWPLFALLLQHFLSPFSNDLTQQDGTVSGANCSTDATLECQQIKFDYKYVPLAQYGSRNLVQPSPPIDKQDLELGMFANIRKYSLGIW